MISNYLYVAFAVTFLSVSIYVFSTYIKATYTYIIDGADLRVCTLSQCMVFITLVFAMVP